MTLSHSDFPSHAAMFRSAKNGSHEAQLALLHAYQPLILKLLKQEKDLLRQEDLNSKFILGILEAIRHYQGDEARFPGYVKKMLRNIAGHHAYYAKREKELFEPIGDRDWLLGEETEYEIWRESLHLHVQQIFNALPPGKQSLVAFRMTSKPPSWAELAKMYGRAPSTLCQIYRRTLKRMRKQAEKQLALAASDN